MLLWSHTTCNIRRFNQAECKRNFRISKHIHYVLHNLSKYYSHLFLKELVPDIGILDSAESLIYFYKTMTVNETHYEMHLKDSLRFTASSVHQLSENLAECECKISCNCLRYEFLVYF